MSNKKQPEELRSEIIKKAQEYTKDYIYNNDWVDTAHCSYIEGATTYAAWKVKYHELVAENEALRRWKEEATRLLSNIYAYSGRHPEMKLGQDTVEFVIARAKERDALKERCEKMERELRRCSLTLTVHPDYQPNSEFRDLAESINEALKEGESNTPAPVQGEKEVEDE